MIYWNNDARFLDLVWDHLFMSCSDICENNYILLWKNWRNSTILSFSVFQKLTSVELMISVFFIQIFEDFMIPRIFHLFFFVQVY